MTRTEVLAMQTGMPRTRTATVDVLLKLLVPHYVQPVPHRNTLKAWLKAAGIEKIKVGGCDGGRWASVYYNVAQAEAMLSKMFGSVERVKGVV